MATREEIYQALWNLFLTHPRCPHFTTRSRFLIHFDDVPIEQCPALFITQSGEQWERIGRGMSFKRTLLSHLVAYDYSADPKQGAPYQAPLVNTMMDIVDEVMTNTPTPSNTQTIGGLVYDCFVEGDVQIAEGLLQGKSVLVVPIKIIMP